MKAEVASRSDPVEAPSRRRAVIGAVTTLALAGAAVWALVETAQTGRVYLFSSQFLEDLPRRFTGPGRFRFVLQPGLAVLLGWRSGRADARAGHPPFLLGLLLAHGQRRELLRSGFAAIRDLLAMGILLDLVFQAVLYGSVHPGAALLVGPVLVCLPYALSRALTNRLARIR